jgi:lipoprotein-releasing system ATP-binding protein
MEQIVEILRLQNISKNFKQDGDFLEIIKESSFTINSSESVAFVGCSGSGKTTLLQICGLLDKQTSGNLFINGKNVKNLTEEQRVELRRNNLGFVFQFHHLLPEFSVLENVMIPFLVKTKNKKIAKERSMEILDELGLITKINLKPYKLSGGEKQRVAIARALINEPSLILADEPTGNLDPENANNVFNMLLKIVKNHNSSLLMVTHNLEMAKRLDRIITIKNKIVCNIK